MRAMSLWLVFLAVAWAPAADAQRRVYTWQDADGVAQFSDRPGVADAELLGAPRNRLSIIEATRSGSDRARRALVEKEIRWQEQGRRESRTRAIDALAERERRCAHLRGEIAAAEAQRQLKKVRALESQWYDGCR